MRTVLLIDKNQDTLQFMKEATVYAEKDIQCLCFVYAEEAMHAMMTGYIKRPDVVFLNLNMPRKNGIQCLRELRSSPVLRDLPVVLYAPKITLEVVEVLKDSGVSTFFEKPNTILGWKKVMREMLNSVGNFDATMKTLFKEPEKSMRYWVRSANDF